MLRGGRSRPGDVSDIDYSDGYEGTQGAENWTEKGKRTKIGKGQGKATRDRKGKGKGKGKGDSKGNGIVKQTPRGDDISRAIALQLQEGNV